MKNVGLIALFSLLALTLWGGQEVVIQDNKPFIYAYQECSGSYQQIPLKIGQFMNSFFSQQLRPQGPLFGVYLNSPGQVKEEELKWNIGMPVEAGAVIKEPLKKGEFNFPKIAVYLYIGPYEKCGEAYAIIMEFLTQNGYRPAGPFFERYLDQNPIAVKPEELKTEIVVPVEKNIPN